jgi:hypothetical protein
MSKYIICFLIALSTAQTGWLNREWQHPLTTTGIEDSLITSKSTAALSGQSAASNDQQPTSPEGVLSAFYTAINDKDYARAVRLWDNPPADTQDFSRAYTDVLNIRLFVGLPAHMEGAAGSVYAQLPTIVIMHLRNENQRILVGCYTMRKSNLGIADNPNAQGWRIYRVNLKPASDTALLSGLLDHMCNN